MIVERIKRKIEPNMCITPQTTPIVYFGNYNKAVSCTISLNPSDKEFINNSGKLLDFQHKERLCSRKKLLKDDNVELSDDDVNVVLGYCNNYFHNNPLKLWFNQIEYVIKNLGGYSYYDSSCVHLDLVQWATTPKWNDIPVNIKEKHLRLDLPFLKYLLNKDFETMFLNGKTVVENVKNHLNLTLDETNTQFVNCNGKRSDLSIFTGKYKTMNIIGWNLYLQSAAVGGNENKDLLCEIIKRNI